MSSSAPNNAVSYSRVSEVLERIKDYTVEVLEADGVFDYETFFETEEQNLAVYWTDGFNEYEMDFGLISANKVFVSTFYDNHTAANLDRSDFGVKNIKNIEDTIDSVYTVLKSKGQQ